MSAIQQQQQQQNVLSPPATKTGIDRKTSTGLTHMAIEAQVYRAIEEQSRKGMYYVVINQSISEILQNKLMENGYAVLNGKRACLIEW